MAPIPRYALFWIIAGSFSFYQDQIDQLILFILLYILFVDVPAAASLCGECRQLYDTFIQVHAPNPGLFL